MRFLIPLLGILLAGCTAMNMASFGLSNIKLDSLGFTSKNLLEAAGQTAAASNFSQTVLITPSFTLVSYTRFAKPGEPLRVYIEGDGRGWNSGSPPVDPTPPDSLVLALAMMDPSPNVAYLARPCQYTHWLGQYNCGEAYWQEKRFAPEVIKSINNALDQLKEKAESPAIELVGFSGGGAVAVLAAAERNDVTSMRTLAANLDTVALVTRHQITPFTGSLNPMDYANMVQTIPQHHFIGDLDPLIHTSIAENFAARVNNTPKSAVCARVTAVPEVTHDKGWKEKWPELLKAPVDCNAIKRDPTNRLFN